MDPVILILIGIGLPTFVIGVVAWRALGAMELDVWQQGEDRLPPEEDQS